MSPVDSLYGSKGMVNSSLGNKVGFGKPLGFVLAVVRGVVGVPRVVRGVVV